MELHRILTEECNNTYIQSFLPVNNFIEENNLNPEELIIIMHATDKPPSGHYAGRYHMPTAPKISLLEAINPLEGSHRSIKCNVQ